MYVIKKILYKYIRLIFTEKVNIAKFILINLRKYIEYFNILY